MGISRRELLLENETNVAMKLAKVTPTRMPLALVGTHRVFFFPGVALGP